MNKEKHKVRVYVVEEIGPKLSKKQPLFAMASGGVYAVQTGEKDKPTNFIRVDKNRTLTGRQRKKLLKARRREQV